ncbi:cation:proton antiporter [Leptolyngbya sp. FACHB-541]|uniref:cation:proton antiporter domain-containing protein n=1 Tax=Leptolyngbya sp. FACHB-541 TaxID=2692810 RepID=UPI001684E729|nr:cation:proton antiporter [Leptolyngbya sp. FACHB-541]MBD2000639.1 cation:proton antiporter [Leptolyngbya sp. FACHB-541]
MAQELTLIVEMVTVLGTATLGGYLANRLHQPVLLGYLLSGIVVGPAGFGLVRLEGDIAVLSEVGVALLLFTLGVEFSLADLLQFRRIALGGGSIQILLTTLLGGGLAYATGWVDTVPTAIFLGAVLSLSSTAVVLKSLIERNEVQTAYGQVMLAMLIAQDLGLGLMLAVLPALTQPPEAIGGALISALVKSLFFIAIALVVGIWLIPLIMRRVVRTGSQEVFILTIFTLCLGVALLTSVLGLGIAMGAFVAGLMISSVDSADQALDKVLPMRDVFSTLFFASIGLLIDPLFLLENIWVLLGLVAIAMIGKALIVTGVVRLFGYSLKTSLTVGLGINQIGEFSFVLAGVAQSLDLFSPRLYGLTVGTTAVTLLVTPFFLKASPYLFSTLERLPLVGSMLRDSQAPRAIAVDAGISNHIVVAGYGRVGQTLVRLLHSQGHHVLVIDNNEATAQALRDQDIPYLYGDASSELVLQKAYLPKAKALAIALPDPLATRLTLKRVLSLAPDLDTIVRAHVNQEIDVLYQLGAQEVVQPEFEAALEMGAHLLLNLGSQPNQVLKVINTYRSRRYRDIVPERTELVVTDLETAMEGLQGEWHTLMPSSPLNGLTLAEADIRHKTGVTIMAIRRGREVNRYPGADTLLLEGDRLLGVGSIEERTAFKALISGKG